jgi:hypothetical protein
MSRVVISVAWCLAMALSASALSANATLISTASTAASTFTSAACIGTTPTATWLTGFETGQTLLYQTTINLAMDTTVVRSGSRSGKITKANNAQAYLQQSGFTQQTVVGFAIRFASLPTADVTSLASLATTGTSLFLGYQTTGQRFTLRWGTNAAVTSSTTVSADTWYYIDLKIDVSVNPNTASWAVDSATQSGVSLASAAQSVLNFVFGSKALADVFTAYYDDVVQTTTLADYPIGGVHVLTLSPDGTGTHNTPTDFQNDDGTAISASSYSRINEVPLEPGPITVTTGIKQITTRTTSYLEFTLSDTSASCIKGVQVSMAMHKTASQSNQMKTSLFDGGTERVVYNGDSVGNGLVAYKTATIAPASAPWTTTALNGLVMRVGYSSDASPIPFLDGLIVEYAST